MAVYTLVHCSSVRTLLLRSAAAATRFCHTAVNAQLCDVTRKCSIVTTEEDHRSVVETFSEKRQVLCLSLQPSVKA